MSFSKFEHGLLPTVIDASKITRVFPGVRGELCEDIRVQKDGEEEILKKGTKIIIQPLNLDKPKEKRNFKITVVSDNKESADPTLPETQGNLNIGETYSFATKRNPADYFKFIEHYEASKEPLFPNGSPRLKDIKQEQIPNCFLLAAMQAIIQHPDGPAFIRGMMRRNDDGTVTVRLFDLKTSNPKYVTVYAAVLANRYGSLNAHKALWVYVLESAYTTLGYGSKEDVKVNPSIAAVYSGGGKSRKAIKILTGLAATIDGVGYKKMPVWDVTKFLSSDALERIKSQKSLEKEYGLPPNNKLIYSELEDQMPVLMQVYAGASPSEVAKKMRDEDQDIAREIADEANPDVALAAFHDYSAYLSFYLDNKEECDKIFASSATETEKLSKVLDLVTENQEAVASFLRQCVNYSQVPIDEFQVHGEVPAFSGKYQTDQFQQFKSIEQALKDGKLVTVDTHSNFKGDVEGLRNNHAYTVLGVEIDAERNICKLILRNPWGGTGRVYKQEGQTFTAVEDPKADIFPVELVDFNTYFQAVIISDSANERFSYHKKREKLYEEMESTLTRLKIDSSSTLKHLVDFNEDFKSCRRHLIDLELMHLLHFPNDSFDPIFSQNLD